MKLPPLRAAVCLFGLLALHAVPALAQALPPGGPPEPASAVTLMALDHPGGHSNPRPQGLLTWLFETRRRTSIAMALAPQRFDLSHPDTLFTGDFPPSPLYVWQGEGAFEPLPKGAIDALGAALRAGGSLFVDVSEGIADGPFERSVTRELLRILPGVPLVPISPEHVLYKSFYLVDRHSGRTGARANLLGMTFEGRLAVVLSANDLLGAMAKDPLGGWAYAVADGDRAREMATRLTINWIMYALCLDYKADQVHLPFILKRRR